MIPWSKQTLQAITLVIILVPFLGILYWWLKNRKLGKIALAATVAFILTLPLQYFAYTLLPVEEIITGRPLQNLAGTTRQVSFYPGSRAAFTVGVDVTASYRSDKFLSPPWPRKGDLDIRINTNENLKGESNNIYPLQPSFQEDGTLTLSKPDIYKGFTHYNLSGDSWSYYAYKSLLHPFKSTQMTYSFKTNPPPFVNSVTLVAKRADVDTIGDVLFTWIHGLSLLLFFGATLFIAIAIDTIGGIRKKLNVYGNKINNFS